MCTNCGMTQEEKQEQEKKQAAGMELQSQVDTVTGESILKKGDADQIQEGKAEEIEEANRSGRKAAVEGENVPRVEFEGSQDHQMDGNGRKLMLDAKSSGA